MLGGGMRQVGILAAAGLVALENGPGRLKEDHAKARLLADRLFEIPGIKIDPANVETNIVIFDISATGMDSSEYLETLERKGLLAVIVDRDRVRMVTHLDVSEQEVQQAADIVGEIHRKKM